ncbi:LPXTG cell wall anchor domain-containing protein [Streptococcus hyovaginalis]
MFKNDVKGHGTIKKLRTGAVVSVLALGVAGVGGVVSADEVGASEVTSVAEAPSTDGVSEPVVAEPVVETVTAEQVATAKVVATEANQAVTAQEGVVARAEQAVTANDASITDLNNQIQEVSAVTPEVVASAEAEADTAEQNLVTANQAVTSAEASLADATNKVESQEGVVASAEAEADKTASAVADAQSKVEGLSTTADTAELEQNVSDLSAKVETDTTNVENAKSALEAAKLAETNKTQAIEDQKAVVASAEENVDSTAKAYSDAIVAQQGTQAVEDSAKSAFDSAKEGTLVTETVKVGETTTVKGGSTTLNSGVAYSNFLRVNGIVTNTEYVNAIKALADGSGSVQAVRDAIASGYIGNRLDTLGGFGVPISEWSDLLGMTFSDTDEVTEYAVHDLDEAVLEDLASFYVALVNQMRTKVGTAPMVVTDDIVAKAKQNVTDMFNTIQPRFQNTNDAGIEPLFNSFLEGDFAVPVSEAVKSTVDSETLVGMDPYAYDSRYVTMGDLKRVVMTTLYQQLYLPMHGEGFGGLNGERATDFEVAMLVLGLKGQASSGALDLDLFTLRNGILSEDATVVYTYGDASGEVLANPYETRTGGSTTVEPIYETVTRRVVDEVAVANAQTEYDEAVKANQLAKDSLAIAEANYTSAQEAFVSAQKQLSDLQSGTADIPALEQAVKDAETQLEIDQASLQTAKETLALAKASAVDKAKALEDAKAELAEAIKANESAQGVLTQENETLEVLRKAVEVAELALAEAETEQAVAQTTFDTASAKASNLATKLANKDSILAELNSQLAEATSKSETLRAELETAKELLETLKADANAKNVEYLRLLGLKAEQDKAEAEVGTNQVANIKNVSSQTNQSVHNKAITAKITQNIVSRHQAGKTSYQASLPETGDESSLFTIMGVSLLLGLGFVGKRRKV